MSAKSLTIAQVATAFNVSQTSVFNWRKGSSTRDPLVPVDPDMRNPTFTVTALKAFAKRYGLTMHRDPLEVLSTWEGPAIKKPGPKPGSKRVVAAKRATTKRVKAKVKH